MKRQCNFFSFLFLFEKKTGFFPILENIALHKSAWQLYPYEYTTFMDILNASKAVDGLKTNLSFSGQQCTQSANYKYEALWRVDLGDILGIHSITIYYRTDNLPWGQINISTFLFTCIKLVCLRSKYSAYFVFTIELYQETEKLRFLSPKHVDLDINYQKLIDLKTNTWYIFE